MSSSGGCYLSYSIDNDSLEHQELEDTGGEEVEDSGSGEGGGG